VSITSTDAFWNALSADYTEPTGKLGTSAAGISAADQASNATAGESTAATVSAQATTGNLISLLAGQSPAAAPSAADELLSQVLNKQSPSAAAAVSAVVNQGILDTLI
jgi:hypothetical protein